MHACGHDGHTAMLLAAARQLAAARDFAGTACTSSNPPRKAAGAKAMIEEGLIERFAFEEVYAHSQHPRTGDRRIRDPQGPMMAVGAVDDHARRQGRPRRVPAPCARPHRRRGQIVTALQTSCRATSIPRRASSLSPASCRQHRQHPAAGRRTRRHGANAVAGGARPRRKALREIVAGIAAASGVIVTLDYRRNYPVTVNAAKQAEFAANAPSRSSARANVNAETPPAMVAEDFSFMLEARPGAFIWLGNGDSAGLHHPNTTSTTRRCPMAWPISRGSSKPRSPSNPRSPRANFQRQPFVLGSLELGAFVGVSARGAIEARRIAAVQIDVAELPSSAAISSRSAAMRPGKSRARASDETTACVWPSAAPSPRAPAPSPPSAPRRRAFRKGRNRVARRDRNSRRRSSAPSDNAFGRDHRGRNAVEEIAVVADQQDRAGGVRRAVPATVRASRDRGRWSGRPRTKPPSTRLSYRLARWRLTTPTEQA